MSAAPCVDPTRAQLEAFKQLPRDVSIDMLNLVRFRDLAAYPEGHAHAGRELTGAQAYALYAEETEPLFAGVGGAIVWRGALPAVLIGPEDERWDVAFIARYPDAKAFLQMVSSDEYRRAVVHRQAAVQTSRLVRTATQAGRDGASF